MICLGIRLRSAGPGRMAAWVNGLLVSATWHGSRVTVEVRDADSTIVVRRSSATLDGASDKVREVIAHELPRWRGLLWGIEHGKAVA